MPPFLGQGMCASMGDAANLDLEIAAGGKRRGAPETVHLPGRAQDPAVVAEHWSRRHELGLVIGELGVEAANERDARLRAGRAGGNRRVIGSAGASRAG